jgi:hypothetical protein
MGARASATSQDPPSDPRRLELNIACVSSSLSTCSGAHVAVAGRGGTAASTAAPGTAEEAQRAGRAPGPRSRRTRGRRGDKLPLEPPSSQTAPPEGRVCDVRRGVYSNGVVLRAGRRGQTPRAPPGRGRRGRNM